MKKPLARTLSLLLTALLILVGSIATASSASAKARPPASVSTATVTGTLANGTGAVAGTFNVQRFANQNGTLKAIGTFTGTITDANNNVLASGSSPLTLPVNLQQTQGSCQILHLVLGPLDLNLLGLMVHLDTVTLDITAQQGPGNLLGNLLCAIAGLLDSNTGVNAIVTQIANLLNQLLAALG